MRWYVSYPILAAGLALGLDVLYPGQPGVFRSTDAGSPAAAASEPDAGPIVVMASDIDALPAAPRIEQFSPGNALLAAELPNRPTSVLDYLAQTLTPQTPVPPAPQPVDVAAWKSTVTRDKAASSPEAPLSRVALARDIQRELQRMGCYLGEIDGVWGGGSQRAVLVFMDRVNASLPTREPDVFMLSLLKAQTAAICGASCPSGQSLTALGRCVPSTLVAQADKAVPSSSPQRDMWEPVVAEAHTGRAEAPFGRMSIGGPKLDVGSDDVKQLSTGWSSAAGDGGAAAPPLARTAALDEADLGGGDPAANAAASSFDTAIAPSVKRSKSSGSRAKAERPRRTSTYRHVQRLFTHPLGM